MKKIFWVLGIGLFGLIVVLALVAGFYLGPIVKLGIEQVGPKVTQVPIKVAAVDISLLSGSATVKGLVVGNPKGYSAPQAISVGNIAVRLDPLSVSSNKIRIHSVQVKSPEITFEGDLKGNNLNKILDNINAFTKNIAPPAGNPTTSATQTKPSKPAPKIQVDDFVLSGARVQVNFRGLGSQNIVLPDIHLTGLGKDSAGLTPEELTRVVFNAVSRDTMQAVSGSVTELGKGVRNLGKEVGKTGVDSVNKITNSIGGMFKK